MSDGDLNTQVLREIRDEIRATRTELKAEIAGTNARLDTTNARLEVVEHTLSDLASQQVLAIRYMKNTFGRHQNELEELDDRVTAVEDDPKRSGS
ncbi:MAG: hypothetical protein JNL83_16580 [Myxococcales bacterium]|nr:hypothetical protein [Myxococcales bacterium]